jgi:membrane protease YdiL (CAAX protease family)
VLFGSLVPSSVAVVLTATTRGRGATRTLLGRLLRWRIGLRWYLVLLGPTAIVLAAITLVWVLGDGPSPAIGVSIVSALITIAFMTFPGSALGEEIGWRGYALPRLQTNRSALAASLILGCLHALWHLPLWLRGIPDQPLSLYPAFAIQVVALAVIYTWCVQQHGQPAADRAVPYRNERSSDVGARPAGYRQLCSTFLADGRTAGAGSDHRGGCLRTR